MAKWNIYIGKKKHDTVFYNDDLDMEYVRTSLINHDNYPNNIRVIRARKRPDTYSFNLNYKVR